MRRYLRGRSKFHIVQNHSVNKRSSLSLRRLMDVLRISFLLYGDGQIIYTLEGS